MQTSDQQRIGERYELRQCIGIGGMARVYLAHDRMLARDVAVKILNPALASDPLFVERFRREALAAAMLNHPNIVTIFDTGTTDGTYYIVMEYVPGPNLRESLRERGPLPEIEACAIGAQVAAALEAAHTRGLIHRDIKPHNILLHPLGTAKVTDFGIARAAGASQLTSTQTVMGTAHYLSPEQALHQPVDGRSDLYSLGIVLYEALTGRLPFVGESLVAVAMQHVHEAPAPPRAIRPAITPEAEAVVMRALAKNPAERYQTAAAMRDALLHVRETARLAVTDDTLPLSTGWLTPGAERTAPRTVSHGVPVEPFPPKHFKVHRRGRQERRHRGGIVALLTAVVCLVVVGIALVAARLASGTGSTTAGPATAAPPTVYAQATPSPTQAPSATPAPTTRPTALPAVTIAAPLPSSTPLPAPTVTAASTTSVPAPLPPTARPAVAVPASTPDGAVKEFYRLAALHDFNGAAQLWSDRMKRDYPIEGNLIGHFNPVTQIDVQITGRVSVDPASGTATVPVEVIERRAVEPTTRRYVGSWSVVRGPSGWLLDQPTLNPA